MYFAGIGLLASFLSFEARKRISAREAMRNPYFDSLGPGVALLKDSEYLFRILNNVDTTNIHSALHFFGRIHGYSQNVYIHVSPVWSLSPFSLSLSVLSPTRALLIRSHRGRFHIPTPTSQYIFLCFHLRRLKNVY